MPVTVLSGPPSALSRDELVAISAETPSTFEGIPPLTRHHEPEGVRVRVDPPFEGFTGDGLDGQLFVTEECAHSPSPLRVPSSADEQTHLRRALSFFSPSSSLCCVKPDCGGGGGAGRLPRARSA